MEASDGSRPDEKSMTYQFDLGEITGDVLKTCAGALGRARRSFKRESIGLRHIWGSGKNFEKSYCNPFVTDLDWIPCLVQSYRLPCAFGWLAHSRNSRLRLFTEDTRLSITSATSRCRLIDNLSGAKCVCDIDKRTHVA